MVDLPPELYRPIVEHVQSMRDLCALGLVCRDLQYEAERLIYRNIPDYPPKSLLVTLVSNPRLHPHVWRLGYFHFQRRRVGKFFVLNLLRPLCNLVSLTIEHASVLEAAGACNFRLKSLQLDYPWDRHVANFVESQPDLEELNAGTSESGSDFVWPIQSSSLPNLSIVTAPLALLFHLVPHRPVVHIRALRDGRFGPQFHSLAESLALSIGPVRTFRYDHLDPTKLNYLAYHLPDLRYVGVAEFDDSFTQDAIAVRLSQFKSLEGVQIHWTGSVEHMSSTPSLDLATSLRAAVPSFQFLTLSMVNIESMLAYQVGGWNIQQTKHDNSSWRNY